MELQRLEGQIRAKLSTLTDTEKRIASFIISNAREIPLVSVHELAQRLETGSASIVRVCGKLGYKGFAGLKKELKNHLKEYSSPMERFSVSLAKDPPSSSLEIWNIAEQEVENINATLAGFDKRMFERGAEYLCEAEEVVTVGMGISNCLAEIAAYLLLRIGIRSRSLRQAGLRFTEQVMTVDSGDVIIAFSFEPYSYETVEVTQMARAQGAKIIAFTNSMTAPIVEHAHVTLISRTESRLYSNSLSPILVVLDALLAYVAGKTRPRSTKALKKVSAIR